MTTDHHNQPDSQKTGAVENLLDLKGLWPRELWPLFCTARIPVATINKFLLASEECSKRLPYLNRDNIWTLILTHSQTSAVEPTAAPISESQPSTTFVNATLGDLGTFCRQRFCFKEGEPQAENPIVSDSFGVMDERSLEDDTIILVRWESWIERIDPNSDDDSDEAWRKVEDWANVRVPFHQASKAVAGVGEDLGIHDYSFNLEDRHDGVCLNE